MNAQTYATEIVKKLVKAGYIAYFAGGWVRDFFMGHPSDDIDIATNAPPEKILDLFPRTLLVGLAFGVVIVLIDGHQFEVATFRRDMVYLNGRKPEKIEFSTPEEDAGRRDFTINGMFYDPLENVIHDYVQGASDLKKGVVRAIGDPSQRFLEDRLRMVRAIRFASRFGFAVDPETQQGIRENAETLFPAVAMERLWQEFNKMSKYPRFDMALIEMHRLGLLPVIFPALQDVHLNDIKKRVVYFSLFPQKCPTILYLIQLFPQASTNEGIELCRYLRTSNQDVKLVEFYLEFQQLVSNIDSDDVAWAHFFANASAQLCLDLIAVQLPKEEQYAFVESYRNKRNRLQLHIGRISQKKPLVTAKFLQEHGILPGRQMGALLNESERLAVTRDLSAPHEVLAVLKTLPIWRQNDSPNH